MKYIDRTTEVNCISSFFTKSNESSVLITCSKTGVGKTSLSKKFIQQNNEKFNKIIQVTTNQINRNETNIKGTYILEIFKAIHTSNIDKNLTFNKFVLKQSKIYKKYILNKFLDDIKEQSSFKSAIIKVLGINILKRLLKLGNYDTSIFFEDYSITNLRMISDYVHYFLKNTTNTIITIDNVQNMDEYSYNEMLEWITQSKDNRHFFILEYTEINDDRIHSIELKNDLKALNINVELLYLKRMSYKNALEAVQFNTISDEKILIPEDTEKYYLNNTEGNIRSLEDYLRVYNRDSEHIVSFEPIIENILFMENDELFLFSLICINESKINIFEIDYLTKDYNIDIDKILYSLENKYNLIIKVDDNIIIKHASIIDEWKISKNKKIKLVKTNAYNAIAKHYEKLLHSIEKSNRQRSFIKLIKLYSEFDPNKIYDLLNNFGDLIVESLEPDRIKEYIEKIDVELYLNAEKFQRFYYKMIDLCLEIKLFATADTLLTRINDCSNKYIFYKSNIYIESEHHIENIDFLNNVISYVEDDYLLLYLKLFLIISYRSLNNYKMVQKIKKDIDKYINSYSNSLFLGFYLRLAELYSNRIEAIPLVEKSVEIFKEKGQIMQTAKSRVALSFLYAITGNTKGAITQSNMAEQIMITNYAHKHIFYNNKAAIYLLNGETGNEILDMLKLAESTANVLFDKLAIYNNMLVYSLEIKDDKFAIYSVNKIKQLMIHENDKHLLALLNYNIYYYYHENNNNKEADKYYMECLNLLEHCKSLKARINNTSTNDGTDILISKPWHVCFLDYWDIDYIENI